MVTDRAQGNAFRKDSEYVRGRHLRKAAASHFSKSQGAVGALDELQDVLLRVRGGEECDPYDHASDCSGLNAKSHCGV
jgi:hypothetical protein